VKEKDKLDERKKKIACFRCLGRKEKIDRIERYFLMLKVSLEHHIKHKTELKEMMDELDQKITEVKEDFNEDFIGCI